MAAYSTHKTGARGKATTVTRHAVRANKYEQAAKLTRSGRTAQRGLAGRVGF